MTPEQHATVKCLTTPAGMTETTGRHGTSAILIKTIIAPGDTLAIYTIAGDGSHQRHADEPFTSNPSWLTPPQLQAELTQNPHAQLPMKESPQNV